jgi:hypothetical protein
MAHENVTEENGWHVVESRLTTQEEQFFLDSWCRGLESSLARVNEALGKMVTLATAMAGGSVLFLKDDACTGWGRFTATILFVVAVVIGAYGSIPRSRPVEYQPEAVKASLIESAAFKRKWLLASFWILIAGFAFAVVGSIWKSAH